MVIRRGGGKEEEMESRLGSGCMDKSHGDGKWGRKEEMDGINGSIKNNSRKISTKKKQYHITPLAIFKQWKHEISVIIFIIFFLLEIVHHFFSKNKRIIVVII